MLSNWFIFLIFVSTAVGYYFYFRDMFTGSTRPNLVSWFIWMLAPFLGAFFALKAGIGIAVLPIVVAGLGPLLVLIISLYHKNTYWQLTWFDFICGMFALIALIFYIITRNTALAIFFIILSDGLAAIPTLVKSWRFPETETGILYLTGVINNTIGLLVLKDWSFPTYSLGIYFIIVNTLLVFFIYRKKIFPPRVIA